MLERHFPFKSQHNNSPTVRYRSWSAVLCIFLVGIATLARLSSAGRYSKPGPRTPARKEAEEDAASRNGYSSARTMRSSSFPAIQTQSVKRLHGYLRARHRGPAAHQCCRRPSTAKTDNRRMQCDIDCARCNARVGSQDDRGKNSQSFQEHSTFFARLLAGNVGYLVGPRVRSLGQRKIDI